MAYFFIFVHLKQVFVLRVCFPTYILLAGLPGVARDEKLAKQIFEIAWREKGWIG